jgi:hypothetical protein
MRFAGPGFLLTLLLNQLPQFEIPSGEPCQKKFHWRPVASTDPPCRKRRGKADFSLAEGGEFLRGAMKAPPKCRGARGLLNFAQGVLRPRSRNSLWP